MPPMVSTGRVNQTRVMKTDNYLVRPGSAVDLARVPTDHPEIHKNDKGAAVVPDALAALAYDATNLVIQAIKDAGTADDTDKVRDAMNKISYVGVSGKITMDAQHNPVKSAVILQVKSGKVNYVTSVAP